MEQGGSDLWPIISTIIVVGVAIIGFQRQFARGITDNADKAHELIGERINDLRADIKALTERFDRHLEHHASE